MVWRVRAWGMGVAGEGVDLSWGGFHAGVEENEHRFPSGMTNKGLDAQTLFCSCVALFVNAQRGSSFDSFKDAHVAGAAA